MKLGIDGLRGQEQERLLGRLAGDDVFLGDVRDVLAHVRLEGAHGELALRLVASPRAGRL